MASIDTASDEHEDDALEKLTMARHAFEAVIVSIKALEGNVWEARSPNTELFAQETNAWRRSHPESEWYSEDYKKYIEKL